MPRAFLSKRLRIMIDFTSKGTRCRAKRMIRSHVGMISPLNEGIITYEIDNLERRLILVQWNTGVSTYVFADEIEIIDCNDTECSANGLEESV
jgi:hypothetical protein